MCASDRFGFENDYLNVVLAGRFKNNVRHERPTLRDYIEYRCRPWADNNRRSISRVDTVKSSADIPPFPTLIRNYGGSRVFNKKPTWFVPIKRLEM